MRDATFMFTQQESDFLFLTPDLLRTSWPPHLTDLQCSIRAFRLCLQKAHRNLSRSSNRQLIEDVRPPIKAKPGRVERYDTEYQRNGTRNLFMFCEPKGGWRHVEVTGRRTAVDFAHQMKWLVEEAYPHARVVRLVLDNLNTHKLGSLYEAFGASEARRIAKRLDFTTLPHMEAG